MKSYKIMGWLIPTALLIGFIVVMFLLFTAKVEQKGQDIVEDNIAMTSEEYALRIGNELAQIEGNVEYAAEMYRQYGTIHNMKKNLIKALCNSSAAYMAVVVDEVGVGLNNSGNLVKLGGLPYFYHAKNGNHWFYTEDDGITGKSAVVYTATIEKTSASGTDGEMYVMAYYSVKDIFKLVKIENYSSVAFFAMLDENYEILSVKGDNEAYLSDGNIRDVISRYATNENKQAVKSMNIDFKNKQLGAQVVTVDGDVRSLCYAPISVGDFYFIIGVENDYVLARGHEYYEECTSMLVAMIIAIGVFFALVLIINFIVKIVDKKQKSELQIKADTDLLTGLTNKAATIRMIKEYMAQNPNGTGVLFVIDIDNFKKINDTMGHAFGDEVLKELGHQLRSMFRAMDVVGRFGGDEFMVFMTDIKDPAAIKRNGDRLRDFFRNFKAGEYVKYSVTASIGGAIFSEDGKDFDSLFKTADKAVYVVKKRGKNDVAFYGDVKEEAETQLLDYKGRED